MRKTVWAKFSPCLFIHCTIIAQICRQFYHGGLLSMKKEESSLLTLTPAPFTRKNLLDKGGKEVGEEVQSLSENQPCRQTVPRYGRVNTAN